MRDISKVIGVAVAAITGISLISVGFASWVITENGADGVVGGNVITQSISDGSVQINATSPNANIVFGSPANSLQNTGWIVSEAPAEQLSFDVYLSTDYGVSTMDIALEVFNSAGEDVTEKFYKCIDDGILDELKIVDVTDYGEVAGNSLRVQPHADGAAGRYTVTGFTEGVMEYVLQFNFRWGALFDYQNPITFFNYLDSDELLSVDINGRLSVDAVQTAEVKMTASEWAVQTLSALNDVFSDSQNAAGNGSFVLTFSVAKSG